jgi:hypothetical protein
VRVEKGKTNIAFFSYVKELPVGKTIRKDKKKRKRRENHKNIRVWCIVL